MCAWRRSMLIAHQIKLVAHEAVKRQKMRWLFLTLTVKNVEGSSLKNAINDLMKAWDKFSRRKEFKRVVIGWFRSFEVTRNPIDGTFHPHFHVLLGVSPSYFKGKDYLTQEDWTSLWKDCLDVDYKPIVDIRIVKNKKRDLSKEMSILEEKGIELSPDGRLEESSLSGSAVAELAKYATKSDDYLVYKKYKHKQVKDKIKIAPVLESGIDESKTDEVVMILDDSLSRRRLFAYGGLLKEVWQDLEAENQLQDVEDDSVDLVHVDDTSHCQCSVCGSDMLEELYSWLPDVRNYIKKEVSNRHSKI